MSRDFDFLFGRWHVANRRLRAFVAGCDEWIEFDTRCEARPILGGLGNVDTFAYAGSAELPAWDASTVRLYEPATGTWRIYWASSLYPGAFDAPMEGRFDGPDGLFLGEDVVDGQPVGVRFLWSHSDGVRARWEQAFRFPGDETWHPNWIMDLTRVEGAGMDETVASEFPRSIGKVADRELGVHGITRYDQLAQVTSAELLAIHGVGPKAVAILADELTARGLAFRTA